MGLTLYYHGRGTRAPGREQHYPLRPENAAGNVENRATGKLGQDCDTSGVWVPKHMCQRKKVHEDDPRKKRAIHSIPGRGEDVVVKPIGKRKSLEDWDFAGNSVETRR